MATMVNRGSRQWQARARRKGYPPVIKTFETKAEAEGWARMVESEMGRGVYVSREEAENTTFAAALGRHLADVTPRAMAFFGDGGFASEAALDTLRLPILLILAFNAVRRSVISLRQAHCRAEVKRKSIPRVFGLTLVVHAICR